MMKKGRGFVLFSFPRENLFLYLCWKNIHNQMQSEEMCNVVLF